MSLHYAEHRTMIKFCVNLGNTPTQTQGMLEAGIIIPSVFRASIFKLHNSLSSEDDKGRRRTSTLTVTSIRKAKDIIEIYQLYNVRD